MRAPSFVVTVSFVLVSLAPAAARASDEGPKLDSPDEAPAAKAPPWPQLDPPASIGVGVEGYGGIAAQWTRGDERAHALVGALARLRFHYVQIGGTYEVTDSGEAAALAEPELEHWRAVGAFVGVFLPYHHWVDVEGSVGLVSRTYANPSAIYGTNGFEQSLEALTLRVGVSARASRRTTAMRVGAELVATADLGHAEPEWKRRFLTASGSIGETTGTTPIGGVSIGLVLLAGFEIGGRAR
jgi:hypothetical protein